MDDAMSTESRRPRGPWRRRILLTALVFTLTPVIMHQLVLCSAWGHVHVLETAPGAPVILVLGASVRPDKQPSDMLLDRLVTAAQLYRMGRGAKILVSGDHGHPDYDEVSAMARTLEEQGVAAEDIFLDHAGFRTLDSMYRARRVFGVERALVVSNPFHLSRAVFLGRSVGLEVEAVAAKAIRPYSLRTRLKHDAREVLARLRAWLDVYVLGTQPRSLAGATKIEGDGRRTR